MWQQYAPEPRMKLNLGIRRRLAPLLDNDRRKIELANSLLFTLLGSPIIYYGDEIGMGDDIEMFDRNGVRTPMQWDDSPNAGFTTGKPFAEAIKGEFGYDHINVASQLSDNNSLFHTMKKMIQIRKQFQAFGKGRMEWVETGNSAVAAYIRKYEDETLLILNNLGSSSQTVNLPSEYFGDVTDLLTDNHFPLEASLVLQPYSHVWLKQ